MRGRTYSKCQQCLDCSASSAIKPRSYRCVRATDARWYTLQISVHMLPTPTWTEKERKIHVHSDQRSGRWDSANQCCKHLESNFMRWTQEVSKKRATSIRLPPTSNTKSELVCGRGDFQNPCIAQWESVNQRVIFKNHPLLNTRRSRHVVSIEPVQRRTARERENKGWLIVSRASNSHTTGVTTPMENSLIPGTCGVVSHFGVPMQIRSQEAGSGCSTDTITVSIILQKKTTFPAQILERGNSLSMSRDAMQTILFALRTSRELL